MTFDIMLVSYHITQTLDNDVCLLFRNTEKRKKETADVSDLNLCEHY